MKVIIRFLVSYSVPTAEVICARIKVIGCVKINSFISQLTRKMYNIGIADSQLIYLN